MANFKLIRDIAKKKGISIRSLAQSAGVSESQIHHLVKIGSTNTQTLETIAGALGVPVGTFFGSSPAEIQQKENLILELKKENALLRELLEEKERTIKILMNK